VDQLADYVMDVRRGNVDVVEQVHRFFTEAERSDKQHAFFNTLSKDLALTQARKLNRTGKALLAGVMVSVKDNICVKGVETTAGSAILRGYKPVYHATAVDRIIQHGGIITGKTAMDEFGFGGFSVNVGLGFRTPRNPHDTERSCGGSSGGAGGIAAKTAVPHLALAESTGGSIVNPAAFCGAAGLCPTYGRVSRYGLLDYASSLDKIGLLGKSVADVALGLQAIAGQDPLDSTSAAQPVESYLGAADDGVAGLRIGIIREGFGDGSEEGVQRAVRDFVKVLEGRGARLTEVSLPLTARYGVPSYYLLAMAEASTNLARYCGMRYGAAEPLHGSYNEYFTAVRSKYLGPEAKRRVILGTFARMAGYRDAYYLRAASVRRAIIEEYQRAFKDADILVSPTMPFVAPRFDELARLTPLQHYLADVLTVGPNLAGLPHLSVPCGKVRGMPVGALAIAGHFQESTLVRAGGAYESG
jgi:aspartyl-tRNA(Asn)/glutamyl-tRNA(Gln) amidotransferase subunit A